LSKCFLLAAAVSLGFLGTGPQDDEADSFDSDDEMGQRARDSSPFRRLGTQYRGAIIRLQWGREPA
jgi:hypothetical protein